jgi:hypothetical protein
LTGLCQAYLGKSTMSPWWTGGRTLKRYFAVPAECFGILYGLGGRQGQSNCRPFWRFKRKCELGSHVLLKQLRLGPARTSNHSLPTPGTLSKDIHASEVCELICSLCSC